MTVINKSALVNYPAIEMFNIVDDIDAYPQFLPWCGSAKVLSRDKDEVKAMVEINHSGIRKSFTTCNHLQHGKIIEMKLINGPFKRLHGYWRFDPLAEDACKVSLDLEYEFSNKLLGMAIGPVFSQIANTLVDAFCQRADALHGK
jgi:ribosome-associated toxin RatA of RatAB toxin-antitoxin module